MTDEEKMKRNNPNNEPVGPFTGRCSRCGSENLWDDVSAYGCNDCGWCNITGDNVKIPKRVIEEDEVVVPTFELVSNVKISLSELRKVVKERENGNNSK